MRKSYVLLLVMVAPLLKGCGVLGPKKDAADTFNLPFSLSGCLNGSGERINEFVAGTVDEHAWTNTWDCTINALQLLQTYSSSPQLSPADVQTLASTLLVTDAPVSPELISAAFEVKASILGGTKDLLTLAELTTFVGILQTLKTETTNLIPLFRFRASSPSPDHMLALSQGIQDALGRISDAFAGKGTVPLSRAAMTVIASQAGTVLKLNLPTNLVPTLLAAKVIAFAGSPDAIEAATWARLLRTAGVIGGPIVAAFSVDPNDTSQPNEFGEFTYKIALAANQVMQDAVTLHGGALPLDNLNTLIDTFPNGFGQVSPDSAKKTAVLVFSRFFKSAAANAIDSGSLSAIVSFVDKWRRGQTHLDTIFANYALNTESLPTATFVSAATDYQSRQDSMGQQDVARLIQLAQRYRPLFNADEKEILFSYSLQHSRGGLSHFHWMNLVSGLVEQAYATNGSSLSFTDFAQFIKDATPIGSDLGAIDVNADLFDERRFREMNLFTLASDGNDLIDVDELTYYVANVLSVATIGDRIRADVESQCDLHKGLDGMKWHLMDPACFRRIYYGNVAKYWDHAPLLIAQYNALADADKEAFKVNAEKAARLKGYGTQDMTGYDVKGFVMLTLLQEELFLRWDTDHDGFLDTDEALAAAPLQYEFISKRSGQSITATDKLDAIFTYTLDKGVVLPAHSLVSDAKIAAWIIGKSGWNLHVDRPTSYMTTYTFGDFSLFAP